MIYGIVIDGRYNSLKLGEIYKVLSITSTSVKLENASRVYLPRVCAYVEEDGTPIRINEAIRLMNRKRG